MKGIRLRSEPVIGERMETVGVDWGPKGIVLVHREGLFGIYKIPRHSAWTDNFSPWHYVPAEYGIVVIRKSDTDALGWGDIDLIRNSQVTPGSAWRAAIKLLKYEVGKLDAGDEDTREYLGVS